MSEITERSALVVAHPDDEALWFSSILERVERVVICFSDVMSRPDWSEGRRRAIAQLPISGVISLGLTESEAFNGADWRNPAPNEHGLEVSRRPEALPGISIDRYHANFSALVAHLTETLRHCQNVITHNPWGEYGHEEHVQVYRAVCHVQRALGYRIWFSNYCSNKSHNLMVRYLSGFDSSYLTMNTNIDLARRVESVYRANNCWTWPFSGYQWFRQECFVSNDSVAPSGMSVGRLFPLNYIRIEAPWEQQQASGLRQRIARVVRKMWGSPR
ncbi:MAG: hypothetical protein A2W18_15180 [Candidatus Muproteobacteria bacterium RBG_16_60_9]|uniref:GlcNAc-PI de-N-acetylase n=1 Tax=Candidatus Muproteobacteria bacterium RBG_16_60_9 TaxID=1817755 RepID=A0A1F6UW86_9PROT|nr:MAG: hypothetical protein A2W18_15180 [Candidatus Muproteobacteria bacterium RBG_16_60_9]